MTSLLHRPEGPADAELIAAVRGGDTDAYGLLFERHVEAARRLAGQLRRGPDADDLVSEAFAKVLAVLQRGGGPDLAFRAYLLTAVRRLHVDRLRADSRLQPSDDLEAFDPGVPFRDPAVEGFESAAAARAFASLPERWQLVLWHTEVEGSRPAEVAPLLGISPNSVSALAYRAREGLRQAYLSMHARPLDDDLCGWVHSVLGGYVRGGLSRRDAGKVEHHLAGCRGCAALHLELTEVNARLGAVLAPALLGAAAGGYLAAAGASGGAAVALIDRAKDAVAGHGVAASVAGVAATAVIGGAVVLAGPDPEPAAEDEPPGPAAPSAEPRPGEAAAPRDRDRPGRTGAGPAPEQAPEPPPAQPPPVPTPTAPEADAEASPPVEQKPARDPQPPPEPAGEQPEPSPLPDLAVSASAERHGAGTTEVRVTVTGVPDRRTAILTATGEGLVLGAALDTRCRPTGLRSASCRLDAPAELTFLAHAPAGGAVTFAVSLEATADADPSDNRTTVTVGGL